MKIATNRHDRQFACLFDVPLPVLLDQFDWMPDRDRLRELQERRDAGEIDGETFDNLVRDLFNDAGYSDGFIRYRGFWYHLADFERRSIGEWHGQHCDSFFSAVLVRVSDDGETYRIGTATT